MQVLAEQLVMRLSREGVGGQIDGARQ
jgi:hypothetical protein